MRFPVLAPGSYALVIELPPRFASYREENISIGAGATLERTVVLTLAGVAEAVVVEGKLAHRSAEQRIRDPLRPRVPQDDSHAPVQHVRPDQGGAWGVPTSPASGTVNTVSAFGSAVNENAFLVDGTNFTCPCQGVSRAEPGVDVIQEVQVQSIGASVEYGNIQGAVFNVLTKQGGDRFQYDASYYAQMSGLTSQPVVRPVSAGSVSSSGYERDQVPGLHDEPRRSSLARSAVVLRRVPVPARLRQSARRGPAVRQGVPAGQDLRRSSRGG